MQESSVIQHFLQQGARESLIEGILENLEVRFHSPNLQGVASMLERIEVLERLRQLRRASLQTPSLDAFQQVLDLNEDTDETDSI